MPTPSLNTILLALIPLSPPFWAQSRTADLGCVNPAVVEREKKPAMSTPQPASRSPGSKSGKAITLVSPGTCRCSWTTCATPSASTLYPLMLAETMTFSSTSVSKIAAETQPSASTNSLGRTQHQPVTTHMETLVVRAF